MTKVFQILAIIQIYFIHNVIDCRNIINLLEEDLAPFGGAKLDDENYEIVQFWCNDDRRGLRMKRSDDKAVWYAFEAPIIREKMPVWLVYDPSTIVKADENIMSDAIKMYENPELAFTVASKFDKHHHRYFVGSIGGMNIAPLSNRTARSIQRERPHLFEETGEPGAVDESNNLTLSGYHVIYKPKIQQTGNILLSRMGHPELFKNSTKKLHDRSKRSMPYVVYPEILVVVDYGNEYTSIYELRFLDLLIYTLNFWNSVNLRFMTLANPTVQLKLTGIVVNMYRGAIPAFRSSRIYRGLKTAELASSITDWIVNHIPQTHDILMVQTNLPLCAPEDSTCLTTLTGFTMYPAACRHDVRLPLSGIINDGMDYTGIASAIHEVGHMIGAAHDGSGITNNCTAENDYIMAAVQEVTDSRLLWSPCSREEIGEHLRSQMATCYKNENPIEDQGELVNLLTLPGRTINLETQCKYRWYGKPCSDNMDPSIDVCAALKCSHLLICWNSGPALDGTPCPLGECRMGACRPIISNLTSSLRTFSLVEDY